MPTGKPGSGPGPEARRLREQRSRKRGSYDLSDAERERRRRQMVEQNEAGMMARRKPIDQMSDGELRAFIERADPELVEQAHRLLQESQKPASEDDGSATESETDTRTDSSGFVDPREEPDTPEPDGEQLPDEDVFDTDPGLHAAYVQTRRELRGEAPDEELQAARAFLPHVEPNVPTTHSHATYELIEAVRRAYARR